MKYRWAANKLFGLCSIPAIVMCVATKSSNLLRAPGTLSLGALAGLDCRQRTALMYSLRSPAERSLLLGCQCHPPMRGGCLIIIPLPPDRGILERAVVGLADPFNHPGLDLGHDGLFEFVNHVEGVGRVTNARSIIRYGMERGTYVPYVLYSHLFWTGPAKAPASRDRPTAFWIPRILGY